LTVICEVNCSPVADVDVSVVGSGVVVTFVVTVVSGMRSSSNVVCDGAAVDVVRAKSSAQHRTPAASFSCGAHFRVPVSDFTLEPKLV
jgi:hypothetical protein